MSSESRLARLQAEFASCVRDPALPLPAGLEARRLAIYRELLFNNVRDFVDAAFPVLKSLLSSGEWESLLRDFLARHRAQSPYFRDIPLEFRQWLEVGRADWLAARPWAVELLHYEWAALAADAADVGPDPEHEAGDLLAGLPVVRRASWPLAYRWPVHTLGPASPPAAAPAAPTFLLLWRDDDGVVHQREVTALAARLVELLQQGGAGSGRELLGLLATESGHAGPALAPFVESGAALLQELQGEGLILGIRCDNRRR